jgi:hypothetical protein
MSQKCVSPPRSGRDFRVEDRRLPVTRCHEPSVCQAIVPRSGCRPLGCRSRRGCEPVELGEAVQVGIRFIIVDLDLAEAARERDLARRRELAGVEEKHLVREERVADRVERAHRSTPASRVDRRAPRPRGAASARAWRRPLTAAAADATQTMWSSSGTNPAAIIASRSAKLVV